MATQSRHESLATVVTPPTFFAVKALLITTTPARQNAYREEERTRLSEASSRQAAHNTNSTFATIIALRPARGAVPHYLSCAVRLMVTYPLSFRGRRGGSALSRPSLTEVHGGARVRGGIYVLVIFFVHSKYITQR